MDDYALVINAGSSSLKFCVYQRPDSASWRLEARGQIDGIGTSPRLSAKNETGGSLADEKLDGSVRDGRAALDVLAVAARPLWRIQSDRRGHRVVHGGAKYRAPSIVTPGVLGDLRELIPLAPLHQPYNIAAIEAVSEKLPAVPQVACFDTSSIAASRPWRNWFHCQRPFGMPASSATASTACRTNISPLPCRPSLPRSRTDA
jgi:acetate kinase